MYNKIDRARNVTVIKKHVKTDFEDSDFDDENQS